MATSREQTAPMEQFRRGESQISWRHQRVDISGHGLKTIHFMDTTPNMFMIQNPTDATLYIGITNIPTETHYEWKVNPNTSKTFGRPIACDEVFILNTTSEDVSINLFSVLDRFDLSLLADMTVSLDRSIAAEIKGDGIIKGFGTGVSLPAGTKHIGEVSMSGALPAGTNHIGKVSMSGALPTGTNHIGRVSMSGAIPAGTNHIGEVTIDNATSALITTLVGNFGTLLRKNNVANSVNLFDINETLQTLAANISGGTSITSTLSKEQSGSHSMSFADGEQNLKVFYFTNDSENPIMITWKESTATSNHSLTVKAGETINDIEFAKLSYFNITCTSETDTWRLCYAKLRG